MLKGRSCHFLCSHCHTPFALLSFENQTRSFLRAKLIEPLSIPPPSPQPPLLRPLQPLSKQLLSDIRKVEANCFCYVKAASRASDGRARHSEFPGECTSLSHRKENITHSPLVIFFRYSKNKWTHTEIIISSKSTMCICIQIHPAKYVCIHIHIYLFDRRTSHGTVHFTRLTHPYSFF